MTIAKYAREIRAGVFSSVHTLLRAVVDACTHATHDNFLNAARKSQRALKARREKIAKAKEASN